jgi:hypothetical protein
MECSNCGYELTDVYASRSVQLQWDGEKWIEKHVFLSSFMCPNCHKELSDEQVDELRLSVYWP